MGARVDFYHLTRDPADRVVPHIVQRVVASGGRCFIAAGAEQGQGAISQALWTVIPESFLAHEHAGDADAPEGSIIIGETMVHPAPNGAEFALMADGLWDDAALQFTRAFLFFDGSHIDDARACWRRLGTIDGIERHYWRQDDQGRWREGP